MMSTPIRQRRRSIVVSGDLALRLTASNRARGYADRDCEVLQILSHDSAGADNGPAPNAHARENLDARAQPSPFADGDWGRRSVLLLDDITAREAVVRVGDVASRPDKRVALDLNTLGATDPAALAQRCALAEVQLAGSALDVAAGSNRGARRKKHVLGIEDRYSLEDR